MTRDKFLVVLTPQEGTHLDRKKNYLSRQRKTDVFYVGCFYLNFIISIVLIPNINSAVYLVYPKVYKNL